MPPVIVIGHRRPDMDSIASAIGLATLIRAEGGDARACRAGSLDAQSEWALGRMHVAAPEPLLDAAPTFASVAEPLPVCGPAVTLAEVVGRIGVGARAVPIVGENGRPLALVDARLAVRLLGTAGAQAGPPGSEAAFRAGAVRAQLPVLGGGGPHEAPLGTPPLFRAEGRISDRRKELVSLDDDDLAVIDAEGRLVGVASRARALAPPRLRLALVDHNELGQAVPGAEEAEVVEVLDHHRIGHPATREAIPFQVEPVGAAATLVAERYEARGREIPPGVAGLLLAAIFSDTLVFRSPTTTPRDRSAAERLGRRAGIADMDAFGRELLAQGAGIAGLPADDVVGEDWKEFESGAGRLVVSQAEVRTLVELTGREAELGAALGRLRERRGAVLGALLVTDPVRGRSLLLASAEARLVQRLPWPVLDAAKALFDVGRIVSRKKELVPGLLAALE